jgi:GH15 family glucan-1,4-alpha-glucosidase
MRAHRTSSKKIWDQPDDGIWEVRGGRRHFTHSKVMAWVAFDRAVRSIEEFGLEGPIDRWRSIRDTTNRTPSCSHMALLRSTPVCC